jgi:hypothetical protein
MAETLETQAFKRDCQRLARARAAIARLEAEQAKGE